MTKFSILALITGSALCAVALGAASYYGALRPPATGSDSTSHAAEMQEDPSESCCSDSVEIAAQKAEQASEVAQADAGSRLARIPDVRVTDQDGKEFRLFSDLIEGKTVVINFFFTTCTTVCPVLAQVFEEVQALLGARLGTEVVMLSISVDPAIDNTARLATFAKAHGARDGWHLLTGDPGDIREVLRAFGVYTRNKEEHSSMAVIGHEPTGRWLYNSAFAAPQGLVALLNKVQKGE